MKRKEKGWWLKGWLNRKVRRVGETRVGVVIMFGKYRSWWYVEWEDGKQTLEPERNLEFTDAPPPLQPRLDGRVVYLIQENPSGRLKIGTAFNALERLATLQIGNPDRLELVAVIPGGFALEADLHDEFRRQRIDGEWFTPSPMIFARFRELAARETPA